MNENMEKQFSELVRAPHATVRHSYAHMHAQQASEAVTTTDAFLFLPYRVGFEAAGKTLNTYVLKVGW